MFDIDTIKKNIQKLAAMSPEQWDTICKNCGVCCLYKINIDGKTYYSKYACKHCDLKTKLCKRYQERLADDSCVKISLRDIIADSGLPDSCAYVEKVFGPANDPITIDWDQIKQNPTSFKHMQTSAFKDSTSWSAHTSRDIIPELLDFLTNLTEQ